MMAPMARAATTFWTSSNAIAEPQRREISVLLRWAGERPVTELALELGMTQLGRPNIAVRAPGGAGLVRDRKAGKQRLWPALTPAGCDRSTSGPAGSSGSGTRASTGWSCRRAGPQAGKAGGVTDGSDRTRILRQSATADRQDRDLLGHQCLLELVFEAHAHRRPAPVAMVVGRRGSTYHHAVFLEFRVGGEWDFVMHGPDVDGLTRVDLLDRDRPAGADRAAAR